MYFKQTLILKQMGVCRCKQTRFLISNAFFLIRISTDVFLTDPYSKTDGEFVDLHRLDFVSAMHLS
jgi:hypothetical protein